MNCIYGWQTDVAHFKRTYFMHDKIWNPLPETAFPKRFCRVATALAASWLSKGSRNFGIVGFLFRSPFRCLRRSEAADGGLMCVCVWQATLGRGASLEQWAAWLEGCVRGALAAHERRPDYTARARRLLLDWSFYSSLVIRELTLRSVRRQAGAVGGVP